MKKAIFILGSRGLLGTALTNKIKKSEKKNFDIFTIAKKNSNFNLDLRNLKKLKKILLKNKIDVLINCAAHTNLLYCQKSFKNIYKINVLLPKFLGSLSQELNFKFIHISTDSVYSSKVKNKINKERDRLDHCNNYIKSKIFAEKKIKKNKNNLILRSNFISLDDGSFPKFLIDKIKNKESVNLYHDFYTSSLDLGTYTDILIKIIKNNLSGIYNLGSKDSLSKKNFAIKFAKKINKKLIYTSISANHQKYLNRNLNIAMNVSKLEKKMKMKIIRSNQVINNLLKKC